MFDKVDLLKRISSHYKLPERYNLIKKIRNSLILEVTINMDKTIRLKSILKEHLLGVRSIICLPDGDIVSGSDDETIRIWRLNGNNQCIFLSKELDSWIYSLLLLP